MLFFYSFLCRFVVYGSKSYLNVLPAATGSSISAGPSLSSKFCPLRFFVGPLDCSTSDLRRPQAKSGSSQRSTPAQVQDLRRRWLSPHLRATFYDAVLRWTPTATFCPLWPPPSSTFCPLWPPPSAASPLRWASAAATSSSSWDLSFVGPLHRRPVHADPEVLIPSMPVVHGTLQFSCAGSSGPTSTPPVTVSALAEARFSGPLHWFRRPLPDFSKDGGFSPQMSVLLGQDQDLKDIAITFHLYLSEARQCQALKFSSFL